VATFSGTNRSLIVRLRLSAATRLIAKENGGTVGVESLLPQIDCVSTDAEQLRDGSRRVTVSQMQDDAAAKSDALRHAGRSRPSFEERATGIEVDWFLHPGGSANFL
jgi:hypothetical protein